MYSWHYEAVCRALHYTKKHIERITGRATAFFANPKDTLDVYAKEKQF